MVLCLADTRFSREEHSTNECRSFFSSFGLDILLFWHVFDCRAAPRICVVRLFPTVGLVLARVGMAIGVVVGVRRVKVSVRLGTVNLNRIQRQQKKQFWLR